MSMITDFSPRTECLFERREYSEHYGVIDRTVWMRPVDADFDTKIIHDWMNRPHVAEFWNQAWPVERIREYLHKSVARPGFDPYIAYMDDEPFAYFEAYDPAQDRLKDYYDVEENDVGLHILIGDERYLKRYILRLATTLMRFIFTTRPETRRIVGEPDERNRQVLGLMRFLGFQFVSKLALPEKNASFLILSRDEYHRIHDRKNADSASN